VTDCLPPLGGRLKVKGPPFLADMWGRVAKGRGEGAWRVLEAFVPPISRLENSFSIGRASQLLSHWDDCGDSESGLRGYPLAAVPDPAKMDLDLATIPL